MIIIVMCLFSIPASADIFDSVTVLKEEAVVPYIDRIIRLDYQTFSESQILTIGSTQLKAAKIKQQTIGEIAAYLFMGRYFKNKKNIKAAIANYELALKLTNGRYAYIEPALIHELGDLYYKNDQNALGLENLIKADMQMERTGYKYFSEAAEYLYDLGYAYAYYYEDFASAELYVKKALTFEVVDPQITTLAYNMLGLIYRATGKPAQSLEHFNIALQKAAAQKDTANICEITGNIGYNFYQEGKLDTAMALLQKDYDYGMQTENWTTACLGKIIFSRIYLQKNNLPQAKEQIEEVKRLVDAKRSSLTKKADYTIRSNMYGIMAEIYKQERNMPAQLAAQDSLLLYTNRLFFTKDAKEQAAIQIKLLKENSDYQLKLIKSEERRNILLRNALIILCVLTIIIAILILRQQKQKNKNTEEELRDYANSLVEKNQLIEQFKNEMAQLKNQPEKIEIEIEDVFNKLKTRTILTENDWLLFKKDFERIYKNFFTNILTQIPDITPAEMRLLALTKLGLSSKEMAALQGIATDSITKARYRLRKKIELKAKENSELTNIIKSIN